MRYLHFFSLVFVGAIALHGTARANDRGFFALFESSTGVEDQYAQPLDQQPLAREQPETTRELVADPTGARPGTITIVTAERALYLSLPGGQAWRYRVGVGREGFTWHGVRRIGRKESWPDWRPPAAMLKRRPDLPRHMAGGEDNPLGARAMYLYEGNRDSGFRIHGSNEPDTIGQAVSSGCIRMLNEDVEDLYQRVRLGATVVVL
jgi:lipoprotein-anchoring transpeptidase ErfK/SrfK